VRLLFGGAGGAGLCQGGVVFAVDDIDAAVVELCFLEFEVEGAFIEEGIFE
jgi:hypothetical protein